MIRTWLADITPLYDVNKYQEVYDTLPAFRQEKANCLQSLNKKAQSVAAWALLEKIRKCYQIDECSVYNLSHSGDYVICAVDMTGCQHTQVGCDIQKIEKPNLNLANRYFCKQEYESILERETYLEQAEYFCRYWVLKESFMKATRKGMALNMSSFEIQLGNPPRLIRQPKEFSQSYYYQEYVVQGIPYRIAVCSNRSSIEPKIQMEFKLP